MKYSTGAINSAMADMKTKTAGYLIDFYSGAQPATADSAFTGTLLGSTDPVTLDNPVGKTISKPPAANWVVHCVADGTIGWFRIRAAADTGGASTTAWRADGRCGGTGSNADGTLGSLDAAVGKDIAISTLILRGD